MQKLIQYFKTHAQARKVLQVIAIAAGVVLAALLYVAVIGISVDATGLRGRVAALLTQSLGREVRFEGAMNLEISAQPSLVVRGLHIANAPGFDATDFASMGEARLALDLWPLLRLRLQIEELSGSDVQVHLQVNQQGATNWSFKRASPAQTETAQQQAAIEIESVLARLDIKRVSLHNLNVDFTGANARRHSFELESLLAQLPAGEPVMLALHGKIEKTHAYRLDFTGGSISDLDDLERPWPIAMKLVFMNSQLLLNGALSEKSGVINFGLGTQNLAEFEQLLQTRLPPVGAAYIAGELNYAPGKLVLQSVGGHIGNTTLQGALRVDYGAVRTRVQGELALPALDLRPFMRDKPVSDEAPPKGLAEVYREISNASFSLNALNNVDADLTLRVGQWLSLPGNVHDAKLQLKLERGRLAMPMQVQLAEMKMSGSVQVDARKSPARFKLALGAQNARVGSADGQLAGNSGVQGSLGRFDLQVAARGDRGAQLMQMLDVQLQVAAARLGYGNGEDGRPVQFALDKLQLALPAGKALRGEWQGSLLDKKFSATLRGSALGDLASDVPAPLDFDIQAGSARAKIHALLQAGAGNAKSDIDFELVAPHSGEIASWLGLQPGADAPVNLRGSFNADSDEWHLADFALRLGRSDLALDVMRTRQQGQSLIKLKLAGELLDVEQLQSLLPKAKKTAAASTPAAANLLDIPVLPGGINLADADIEVSIKRVRSASPIAVSNVAFSGKVRDGMMPISPFSADVDDNHFAGAMLLDMRTQQPHAVVWIAADKLDVGSLMGKLGMSGNVEAAVGHLSLQLDLHSSRLGDMLAQSELLANLEGGHLTLNDANTGGKMRIALERGELKSAAGAPVYLDLQGQVNGAPVSIGIQTARAADLINPALPLPFEFQASTAGATIKLSGDIERPFSNKDMQLALQMSGSRLDNLNALTRTSLPPWGPWSLAGKFAMSPAGYEISALRLQVGSSELKGYGKFDTRSVPPRLDVALSAPGIQLDDFRFGAWSPEKSPAAGKKDDADSRTKKETGKQAQQLLSAEVLGRQNATLTVQVDQVLSGQDLLGNGRLEAKLENGSATLGPVRVNTPGGSASLLLKYEPRKNDVALSLRAEAKNFDYGILARRVDRNSEMSGTFSLDVDVNARAQALDEILKYGKGHIDFALWPENLKAGLLDMWAVNVLMALLPAIDTSGESKVNCAIGRFVLGDGKLSDKSILIDTSRMRVSGKGKVDFATENLDFYFKPQAKTPQFLSLAIPIDVSGSFEDFSVGVRASDAAESVGQLATSLLWVPLQMLFGREMAADGRDVCSKAAFVTAAGK